MAIHSDAPRALITGLGGFTGRYLADELRAAGYRVFGTAHALEHVGRDMFPVDLCHPDEVRRVVAEVQPDVVAHLAAISFVAHGDAEAFYRVNVVGTRNLLEALAGLARRPRAVLLASSANVYGNVAVEVIDESVPPSPANDYAVSKVAMEYMARLWMDRLPIVITRPFNYTGVGQDRRFLIPKIVDHFVRGARTIELGNIDVERDFSDVRYVAACYRELLEQCPAGEVLNVCSGRSWSLRSVIDMMSALAGYAIEVQVNPAFVRAGEVRRLLGDSRKLRQFVPDGQSIALPDTLRWMYEEGLAT